MLPTVFVFASFGPKDCLLEDFLVDSVVSPAAGTPLAPQAPAPISASWFVIQCRTSSSIILRLPPGASKQKLAFKVLGVSWSSSNMKCPPMADTDTGKPTPKPQRAISISWMAWLPTSPFPVSQIQCQL